MLVGSQAKPSCHLFFMKFYQTQPCSFIFILWLLFYCHSNRVNKLWQRCRLTIYYLVLYRKFVIQIFLSYPLFNPKLIGFCLPLLLHFIPYSPVPCPLSSVCFNHTELQLLKLNDCAVVPSLHSVLASGCFLMAFPEPTRSLEFGAPSKYSPEHIYLPC